MGKVKARRSLEIVRDGIRFVSLQSRELVTIKQHISEGIVSTEPSADSVPKNCIIKIEQRYKAGEEETANKALTLLVENLKRKVHFIRPPDRIVIRENRSRMEEMKNDLPPVEAVDVWLSAKPPKNIDPDIIRAKVRDYIDQLDSKDFGRKLPEQFHLSGLMISNWMPFKDSWVIENLSEGLVGVVGRYEGQDGRSNRSGKSSVFDAIRFALFGQGRSVKSMEEMIHSGTDRLETGVALQLESGRQVVIQRSFGGQTEILIDGGSRKVKEALEEVGQLLGMTEEDFTRTCFVRQGDLERILAQQSSQLKQDIIRWRGLNIWPSLDALVQSDESELNKERLLVDTRRKVALEVIERGEPSENEIESLQLAIEKIESKRESFAAAKVKIDSLRRELTLAQRIVELKKSLAPKDSLLHSKKTFESNLEKKKEQRDKARLVEGRRENEFSEANSLVKDGFDGTCPIDHCDCPRVKEINEGRDESLKRAGEAYELFQKARSLRKSADVGLVEAHRDLEIVESKLKEIAIAERTIVEIGKIRSAEKIRADIEKVQKDLVGEGIDDGALRSLRDRMATLSASRKMYSESKNALLDCESKLKEISERAKLYRYLRFMFGKSGISSMMVENALEEIEGQVNSILEELGTDHRLKFDPERLLKRLSRTCYECGAVFEEGNKEKFCPECGLARQNERSDELRPMIVENGRKQAFELDSGAGRALVALATRAAMSRFLGASILFLDEVSGFLDDYHLTLLIRFLNKLPSLGFKQVFVISHQKEVDASSPTQIVVSRIQEEGRSTLEKF